MTTRHRYLDVAKGLGILLVVFGHNRIVSPDHPQLFAWVFSFHMPLFLFVSGMTYRSGLSIVEMARRRWYTVLQPYFFTMLLVTLAFFVVRYRLSPGELGVAWLGVVYGTGRVLPWLWMWFLPFLFLINIAYAMLQPVLPRTLVMRALAMTLLLIFGVWLARALWMYPLPWGALPGLPFNADLLAIGLCYFWLGHEFSGRHERWQRTLCTLMPVFVLCLVGLSL